MIMSSLISFIFILMNHPLSLGLILLMQTILISLILSFFMFNFWFSYILFLIMVGGMLILFIYMTSVASNEKFLYNNKILFFSIMMLLFLTMIITKNNFFLNFEKKNFESFNEMNNLNFILSKFLNFPLNSILFLLIIYLFITLIAVVKIIDTKNGPLRQKN
uniref:NADH-ubiquinone oxidoreductase chain 6 n=1 Tax=Nudobius lentus TaxID=878161 RepID=A0A0S2M7W7_9COLE|nr:NADH deshydrogenase subunit 6 [Nudobius lentus]